MFLSSFSAIKSQNKFAIKPNALAISQGKLGFSFEYHHKNNFVFELGYLKEYGKGTIIYIQDTEPNEISILDAFTIKYVFFSAKKKFNFKNKHFPNFGLTLLRLSNSDYVEEFRMLGVKDSVEYKYLIHLGYAYQISNSISLGLDILLFDPPYYKSVYLGFSF